MGPTHPFSQGATVHYDPTGNKDPNGQLANVTKVVDNGDGTYSYSVVLHDRHTARPILPAITGVAESSLYYVAPTPGPGNDL